VVDREPAATHQVAPIRVRRRSSQLRAFPKGRAANGGLPPEHGEERLEILQGLGDQGVVDPSPIPPIEDQSGIPEHPQVVGKERLPKLEALRELTDTTLPTSQLVEDS
jgi:hypothetical protein